MNYQAFTYGSLALMYEAVRGRARCGRCPALVCLDPTSVDYLASHLMK
jgi:hypothetical protein